MRDGTCPRCHGTEVYAARNALEPSEQVLRAHIEPGFRGMRPQVRVELWTYVCATCGLLDTYALDPEAMAFVRQAWLRVPPVTPTGT